ncbi:hypothetical protein AAVH_36194, partial [Aphelenchoides avenae]
MPRYVRARPLRYYVVQKCPSQAVLMLEKSCRPEPEPDGRQVPTVMTVNARTVWLAPTPDRAPKALGDLLPGHRVLVYQYLDHDSLAPQGWNDLNLDPLSYTAHLSNGGQFHPTGVALRISTEFVPIQYDWIIGLVYREVTGLHNPGYLVATYPSKQLIFIPMRMFAQQQPQLTRGDVILTLQSKSPRLWHYNQYYGLPIGYPPLRGEPFATDKDWILCEARPLTELEKQQLEVAVADRTSTSGLETITRYEKLMLASSLFISHVAQAEARSASFRAPITLSYLRGCVEVVVPISADSKIKAARAKHWRVSVPAQFYQHEGSDPVAKLIVQEVMMSEQLVVGLRCALPRDGSQHELRIATDRTYVIRPDETNNGYESRIR